MVVVKERGRYVFWNMISMRVNCGPERWPFGFVVVPCWSRSPPIDPPASLRPSVQHCECKVRGICLNRVQSLLKLIIIEQLYSITSVYISLRA